MFWVEGRDRWRLARVVGLPGLGGALFGVRGGEDGAEDVEGGRRWLGSVGQALVVGGFGDDVGVVEVAAAGHADVEVFAGHAGGGDGVGLVDGDALGAGGGGGVAELDVVGDVVGGQPDDAPVVAATIAVGGSDVEGSVGADGGDVPQRAVADEPVGGVQVAVVVAGDDPIADPGGEPVVQLDA